MKKQILILPLVVFFLVLSVFYYLLTENRNPSKIPSNLINKKVPVFEANLLLKNRKFISAEEFGNEIILVNFFATWCKPCRDEHNFIKRFAEKKGIRVIGINYKDNYKKTVNWLNKLGNPYSDIIVDMNGRLAIDWGVYGIPETFVVSSSGIVKYRKVGAITNKTFKKINSLINELEK
tara:strand:+ start:1140 stop:1673 length:534 start_codon:yes stop_codon:yes gene_type:complete